MKTGSTPVKISNLPRLDEEERDDACYRGQDRAWSSLVGLYDYHRTTEGLTYEKLGWRIKRSRSQVQRWLTSSYNMGLKSFGLLAEGLNADVVIDVVPRSAPSDVCNYCHPREAARAIMETRTSAIPDQLRISSDLWFDSPGLKTPDSLDVSSVAYVFDDDH
jgi:hypothetical protein